MKRLVFKKDITLPRPSVDDGRADEQRIRDTLDVEPLDIPLSVLKEIPSYTASHGYEFSCIVGKDDRGYKIIDIGKSASYSIALDVGTTNIVASLYDNVRRREVLDLKWENPQIAFGGDILARLHYAMTDRAEEAHQVLLNGINACVEKIRERAGIARHDIHAMSVAGNTVMSHFFLGLDVRNIPVEPFTPVVRKPGFFRASDLSCDIHPEALVYVFPNAGGYVGGDIVAGIIASEMTTSDEPSVLIDVGTNVEIVVGSRDWILVGAGAAGPALEEGISLIGGKAGRGIIHDVEIKDGDIEWRTFDDGAPEGICGSGMVGLIYEMYRSGVIGRNGTLNSAVRGVAETNGEKAFTVSRVPGAVLSIKQSEIENFLQSKAAMFTLLLVLVRSVGLHFKDIKRVYIAGALGNGIDVRKAAGIGMLPPWPPETVVPLGNASLKGALMLLEDGDLVERIHAVTDMITYKHMHDDPEFMKEFRGAAFIPHANEELLKG